ncbi:MAG: SDR family oxidoreductase [Chlorobi bacterium]|nr:SDR family oxidoreductase [Chlorobiota bacterium]
MTFAVTGASGHIGNNLCKELVKRGHKVKALLYEDVDDLKMPGIELVRGDVTDKISLMDLCKGVDFVFHLAARIVIDENDRELVYRTNVLGTQNIIEVCKSEKVKRLIHFSTIHAFDPVPMDKMLDETRKQLKHTKMIYEQSKIEAENLVLKAMKEGLDAVIVYPTAIFGPNDFKPSLLGQALIRMYNNSLPMLVKGGYNWVDVRDVVDGAIAACMEGRKGEKYILSGHWMSLTDLSAKIGAITNRKTPRLTASYWLARIGIPFIQLYAKLKKEHPLYTNDMIDILKMSHQNISCEKAKNELGYHSRPIEESIRDTFNSFKQHGML